MDARPAAPAAWLWRYGSAGGFDSPRAAADPGDPGTVLGFPGWAVAVALCVSGSVLTVLGLALQKQAASAPAGIPRLGHMVLSVRWLSGIMLGVIAPIPLQILSYSIAPMSLITPLSGVTVVLNTLLAPRILGERPQLWVDVPASLLILLGTAASTATGVHTEVGYSFHKLLELWGQLEFLVALSFLFVAMLCSIGYMTWRRAQIEELARSRPSNPSLRHVLLPALVAAGCGCFSNILLKASGELFRGRAFGQEVAVCLAAALLPAMLQLNFVNKGLALYQQTIFVPVYSSLLVLTNTFYGLIFYREYVTLLKHKENCGLFSCGVLLVILGVVLFTLRRPDKVDKQNVDSRSVSILDNTLQTTEAAV